MLLKVTLFNLLERRLFFSIIISRTIFFKRYKNRVNPHLLNFVYHIILKWMEYRLSYQTHSHTLFKRKEFDYLPFYLLASKR